MNETVRAASDADRAKMADRQAHSGVSQERSKFDVSLGNMLSGQRLDEHGRLVTSRPTLASNAYGVAKVACRGVAMVGWVVPGARGKTPATFGYSTRASGLGLRRKLRGQHRLSSRLRHATFDRQFADDQPNAVAFRRRPCGCGLSSGFSPSKTTLCSTDEHLCCCRFWTRYTRPSGWNASAPHTQAQLALQSRPLIIAAHNPLTWWSECSAAIKNTVNWAVARAYAERMRRWTPAQGDGVFAAVVITRLTPVANE
jgi:hypothetical protein